MAADAGLKSEFGPMTHSCIKDSALRMVERLRASHETGLALFPQRWGTSPRHIASRKIELESVPDCASNEPQRKSHTYDCQQDGEYNPACLEMSQ